MSLLEKDFEEILINNLSLIEDELCFKGNQVYCEGKRVDILCTDKFGHTLVIEVKRVAKRKDIAQLLDYAGYFINDSDLPVRVMLVANRIPPNFKTSFEYFGIEYLEIPESKIPKEYFVSIQQPVPNHKGHGIQPNLQKETCPANNNYTFSSNVTQKNQTRLNMANRIKKGKMFDQAKQLMKFLLSCSSPVTMEEIVNFMKEHGYSSKSYYDLANALSDNGLISCNSINNKKHYFVVEDSSLANE